MVRSGYVSISVREEVWRELNEVKRELNFVSMNDVLALLVRVYRERTGVSGTGTGTPGTAGAGVCTRICTRESGTGTRAAGAEESGTGTEEYTRSSSKVTRDSSKEEHATEGSTERMTRRQDGYIRFLVRRCVEEFGVSEEELREEVHRATGVLPTREMTREEASKVIKYLEDKLTRAGGGEGGS